MGRNGIKRGGGRGVGRPNGLRRNRNTRVTCPNGGPAGGRGGGRGGGRNR